MIADIQLPNNFPQFNLPNFGFGIQEKIQLKIMGILASATLFTMDQYNQILADFNLSPQTAILSRLFKGIFLTSLVSTAFYGLRFQANVADRLFKYSIRNCLSSHSMDLFKNAGIASYLNGTLYECGVPNIESLVGSDSKNCIVEYSKEFNSIDWFCQDENIAYGSGFSL